jgi:hypothetical protein
MLDPGLRVQTRPSSFVVHIPTRGLSSPDLVPDYDGFSFSGFLFSGFLFSTMVVSCSLDSCSLVLWFSWSSGGVHFGVSAVRCSGAGRRSSFGAPAGRRRERVFDPGHFFLSKSLASRRSLENLPLLRISRRRSRSNDFRDPWLRFECTTLLALDRMEVLRLIRLFSCLRRKRNARWSTIISRFC